MFIIQPLLHGQMKEQSSNHLLHIYLRQILGSESKEHRSGRGCKTTADTAESAEGHFSAQRERRTSRGWGRTLLLGDVNVQSLHPCVLKPVRGHPLLFIRTLLVYGELPKRKVQLTKQVLKSAASSKTIEDSVNQALKRGFFLLQLNLQ